MAIGGVGGAVAGGISGGTSGAVSGFFTGAAFWALGGIATASGAGLLAGGLALGAAGAGLTSVGYMGKAYYHNPSTENGLALVGAVAGIVAGGLTGRGISRLQQMRANTTPTQPTPVPQPNLRALVDEAHGMLHPRAQRARTTAIGRDADGNLYISTNENLVAKPQRVWAEQRGIKPVRGDGHAEETLMNGVPNIKEVEASRGVCLDCEAMMKNKQVSTTTPSTGKRSRNRK